jgi:hypothetical protein
MSGATPGEVRGAFGVTGDLVLLAGGMHRTWREEQP